MEIPHFVMFILVLRLSSACVLELTDLEARTTSSGVALYKARVEREVSFNSTLNLMNCTYVDGVGNTYELDNPNEYMFVKQIAVSGGTYVPVGSYGFPNFTFYGNCDLNTNVAFEWWDSANVSGICTGALTPNTCIELPVGEVLDIECVTYKTGSEGLILTSGVYQGLMNMYKRVDHEVGLSFLVNSTLGGESFYDWIDASACGGTRSLLSVCDIDSINTDPLEQKYVFQNSSHTLFIKESSSWKSGFLDIIGGLVSDDGTHYWHTASFSTGIQCISTFYHNMKVGCTDDGPVVLHNPFVMSSEIEKFAHNDWNFTVSDGLGTWSFVPNQKFTLGWRANYIKLPPSVSFGSAKINCVVGAHSVEIINSGNGGLISVTSFVKDQVPIVSTFEVGARTNTFLTFGLNVNKVCLVSTSQCIELVSLCAEQGNNSTKTESADNVTVTDDSSSDSGMFSTTVIAVSVGLVAVIVLLGFVLVVYALKRKGRPTKYAL